MSRLRNFTAPWTFEGASVAPATEGRRLFCTVQLSRAHANSREVLRPEEVQMRNESVPKLLSLTEVMEIVPYGEVHIWRLERRGHFPRRIKLGARRVAWLESEVREWIAAQVAARDAKPLPAPPAA